jgi:beta-glucanase (GH16 family)
MRRRLLFCLLGVSLALGFTVPPASAAVTVTMNPAQLTSPTTALLTGTVTGRTQVVIDQLVGLRWKAVQTVTANSAGSYQATVPATTTPTYYRGRAWTAHSEQVLVQAEPPPPPPSDACGPQPQRADGTYWNCTFVDDFSGTALDRTRWLPQTAFRAGSAKDWACYLDDPSVVSVADGNLNLSVRRLPASAPCAGQNGESTQYVAGMVTTYHLFSQRYGRFEARVKNKATKVPGLQETFWLWPDDRYSTEPWPQAGEIDVAETYSQYPNLAVPFLHYTANDNGGPVQGLNTSQTCAAQRGVWNTYAVEWTATRIEIFVNGTSCLVNTSADPAFKKPYIVALTQMLGVDGNAKRWNTPLPATMSVDYVHVWS